MPISKLLEAGGLGRNILIYGAANGLAAISPFVLIPILTQHLTPAQFGEYGMFLLLFNLGTILMGLNAHSGLAVNYHKVGDRYPALLLSGMKIPLFALGLTAVCLPFLAQTINGFLAIGLSTLLLAVGAGFFNAFYMFALTTFQASNRAGWYLRLKLLQSGGDIALSFALVVTLSMGLLGRTTAHTSVILVCMVVALFALKRSGDIGQSPDVGGASALFRFGAPLVPHALAGSALMFVDRLVLTNLYGLETAGLYMVAFQVAMGSLLVIEPVNKAFAPWLFKNLRALSDDLALRIVRMSYLYFVALIGMALILYMLNDLVFVLLVAPSFHEAKDFSLFLYLGFSFQGMYYTVTNYLLFEERTKLLAVLSCCTAIITAVLSYTLATILGPKGAAVSFMIGNLVLFLSVFRFAALRHPMPWRQGLGISFARQDAK